MLRFGLCCIFKQEPIKFRRTTAKHLLSLPRKEQLGKLAAICLDNAQALMTALSYCRDNDIGAFRINSQILPLKTHPQVGYEINQLPEGDTIAAAFRRCGRFSRKHNIRTTFHPDQFIVLNSPNKEVAARSLADLRYHVEVAQWVNADVINLHGGGAYGDKQQALERLVRAISALPKGIKKRLTLENDDRVFTPQDLLPVCEATGVALVYDVHHHRCLPDGLSVREATDLALKTWNREPLFHISSPAVPWESGGGRPHHDFIDPEDFPCEWLDLEATVEIEAKAKELAIGRLARDFRDHIATCCKKKREKENHDASDGRGTTHSPAERCSDEP